MRYSISKGTEELHLDGKYWVGDPLLFFREDIIDRLLKLTKHVDSLVVQYGEFDIPVFTVKNCGYYSIAKEDGLVLDTVGMAPVGALMALIPHLLVESRRILLHGELLKLKGLVIYDNQTVTVGEYHLCPIDEIPGFDGDLYD